MASPSSWSDLPKEIQALIKTRLQSPSDIARFRSVCPSWRSSTPPLINYFPFPDVLLDNDSETYYHLNQVTIYSFEPLTQPSTSPTSWLVAVEFVEGKHYFLNALTGLRISPNPTQIPTELNLCNFRVTELHKVYGVQKMHTTEKALFVSSQYYDETLLVVYGTSLVFYKLENTRWVVLKEIDNRGFSDIELYQGKVWGVGYDGRTVVFTSSLDVIEIAPCLLPPSLFPDDEVDAYFYFIESSGDLFVVEFNDILEDGTRNSTRVQPLVFCGKDELLPFKIHKLIVEENRWAEVRHLDGRMFISALEYPLSFSLQIPGGMKNCIVSSGVYADEYDSDDPYVPMMYSVWEIERDKHSVLPFEFRKMFWPPPKWLLTSNQCE